LIVSLDCTFLIVSLDCTFLIVSLDCTFLICVSGLYILRILAYGWTIQVSRHHNVCVFVIVNFQ
jgi:hypothetical protein